MYLYHFSSIENLEPIIESGYLKPRGRNYYGFRGHKTIGVQNKGVVSLTRDFNFRGAGVYRDFCLVLDKEKLQERYRVIPYNDYPQTKKIDPGDNPTRKEFEEVVISQNNKVEINKALVKIIIFEDNGVGHVRLNRRKISAINRIKKIMDLSGDLPDKEVIKILEEASGVPVEIYKTPNDEVVTRRDNRYIKTFESFTKINESI